MNKQAFNKENPVDLFSQLVKVLSRKDTKGSMTELIDQLRELSSKVFLKLKESHMTNVDKIAEDIIKSSAKGKRFDLGPGVEGYIKETADKIGFEIKIEGTFQSGDDIDKTIKDLQNAWKTVDIG